MEHFTYRHASWYKLFMLLFLSLTLGLPTSYPQGPPHLLNEKLEKLIKTLDPKQDNKAEAKVALNVAKQLQLALAETNPSLISSISGSMVRMPLGEYQTEIQKLAQQVSAEISLKASKQKEVWKKQVDEYAQKVELACIKGIPTDQLEALLIASDEVAQLAPRTSRSSNRRSGDEATKLNASIQLLQQWLVFKRLEEKGYIKHAHDKLKYLASSTPSYPILDKAFLDSKIAAIKDAMEGETKRTERGETLSWSQADSLKKLENNKFSNNLLTQVANTLNALPYSHGSTTKYNDRIYLAIQALADCFHFIEVQDHIKAREKLSEFGSESHNVPQLKLLRKKAVFQLTPIIYAKIGAKAPKAGQRLESYIFDLIKEPGSIQEAAIHNDLISFYHFLTPNSSYYSGGKAHKWKESARKQYSLLGSAAAALKSKDYSFALKQFREAQEFASLSGPANASKLINVEIEKLRKLKPNLFETSISAMAAEIESLQNQVDKFKKEAVELRRKTRGFR